MRSVNTHMIVLAREARGLNQNELADRIHMSATNLSKIERGDISISDEVLETIAAVTAYPRHFFTQPGGILPENMGYRRRQKVAQRLITPINAKANIIRQHVQFLTRALEVAPPLLPLFAVSDDCTPHQVARHVRHFWKLPPGPVADLCNVAEKGGISVMHFDFGTERVDSKSLLTEEEHPVVFLNSALQGDRQRFTLAYEIGQLLMHTFHAVPLHRDIVHEANAFAAELLMPEKDIARDFKKGITIPLLGELKKKWKVSMISLLYRADDLGYITPNQKRYLLQQFNAMGIRRREPVNLDIAGEQPSKIRSWISASRCRQGFGVMEMAALLCLNIEEFMELYS